MTTGPPAAASSKRTTQQVLPPLGDEADPQPVLLGTVNSPGVICACILYYVHSCQYLACFMLPRH